MDRIFTLFCIVLLALTVFPILAWLRRNYRLYLQREEEARLEAEREEAAAEAAAAKAEKQRLAAAKKAQREAEQKRRSEERIEAARKVAELNERALSAARELKALDRSDAAESIASAQPAAPQEQPRMLLDIELPTDGECPQQLYDLMCKKADAPKPFAGQTVSFTGTLPGMTRKQAIALVESLGGRAFATMPVGTTLLVVGDKPGMNKLDKADKWIGQVKKITAERFMELAHAA